MIKNIKPLNIIFIGRISFPSGLASSKRRRYLVDYLNKQRISCKFICLRHADSKLFDNPKHGFYGETEYINLSDLFYAGVREKIKYYNEVNYNLKNWLDYQKNNVLIFQGALELEYLPFYLYARKLGYKIVFDQVEINGTIIESSSFHSKIYTHINSFITKFAYKHANGIFVISNNLWKINDEKHPKVPKCLLSNASEIYFQKKKTKFSNPITILYAGTFAQKDGVLDLISAFKKLDLSFRNIRLLLIGKGLDNDMSIIHKAISSNVKIDYLGFVSDKILIENLLNADILTMTRCNSQFANYGFPFKLTEYLSTGNPVLATRVSDVEIYLTDKKNACLVEPENIESIYNGLLYLIKDEKRALELGYNGLCVAQENFSKEKIGKKFVDFLLSI